MAVQSGNADCPQGAVIQSLGGDDVEVTVGENHAQAELRHPPPFFEVRFNGPGPGRKFLHDRFHRAGFRLGIENQRVRRAEFSADRITFAIVTLEDILAFWFDGDVAVGAGYTTHPAFDTFCFFKFNHAGGIVQSQRVSRTGADAGRIVTLRTDHRDVDFLGIAIGFNAGNAGFGFFLGMVERASEFT